MVSFLCRLSLSMCNVRMCSSLSTILLFLIMTYDETAFQQDGRRKRRNEQLIEFRRRKQEKREKKINALRERNKSRLTVGPINDESSNAAIESSSDVEDLDGASIERGVQPSLPAYQIGEIVSVEGDTRERG